VIALGLHSEIKSDTSWTTNIDEICPDKNRQIKMITKLADNFALCLYTVT